MWQVLVLDTNLKSFRLYRGLLGKPKLKWTTNIVNYELFTKINAILSLKVHG